MMAAKKHKPKRFSAAKAVKAAARKVVGTPPPTRADPLERYGHQQGYRTASASERMPGGATQADPRTHAVCSLTPWECWESAPSRSRYG